MDIITIDALLSSYLKWANNGDIQFLEKGSKDQRKVSQAVENLLARIRNASKEQGGLSKNLDWHETHKDGKELWEQLASCALCNIDKGSKGNSRLFDFLEEATRFEDVLYGLDIFYRDHTLHSLWVYLIGEHILRDLLPPIHDDLNWYLFDDIELSKASYSQSLLSKSRKKKQYLCGEVNKKRDSIWCIMALCHDLGYSLSKLDDLNDRVQSVLGYFSLPQVSHIGYSLDIEHQYHMEQFLELMSIDLRIVPDRAEQDVVVKCFRDDSTYWCLCQALERKQHGILSSYLIYKILDFFADTSVRGPAEEWGLEDEEAVENIVRGDILFAIAQHEFEFAHMHQLSSLADVLFLADDLEEFSRFGRQMLSREYNDTMADSKIKFIPPGPEPGADIDIEITFDVATHRSLGGFFKYKAERLCKIYSLDQRPNDKRVSTINSIKMTARKEGRALYFHLCRDSSKTKGNLPATNVRGSPYREGIYNLTCRDDKICHDDPKGIEIRLKEWFENVTDGWWKDDAQLIGGEF